MNIYEIVIEDTDTGRSEDKPVRELTTVAIEAPTAEDALTIARIRHNVPYEYRDAKANIVHVRRVKNISASVLSACQECARTGICKSPVIGCPHFQI